MAKNRLEAIKHHKRIADRGGPTSRLTWIKQEVLDQHGVEKYVVKEGDNWVAVIPPKDDYEYFGLLVPVHYRVGVAGDAFVCWASMLGRDNKPMRKRCPMCEKRNRLYNESNPDEEQAKTLFPSDRYLYLVVDWQSDESRRAGVRLFDAPFGINKGIVSVSTNPRTKGMVDISDPQAGKVLFFTCTNARKPIAKYTGYQIEDRPPLEKAWLNKAFDLRTLLYEASYEEMLESLEGAPVKEDDTPPFHNGKESPAGTQLADQLADAMGLGDGSSEEPAESAPQPEPVPVSPQANAGVSDRVKALRERVAAKKGKLGG